MAETKIKDEVYHLNTETVTWTETDISANQTSLWLEGFRYQVPVGEELVFLPEHTFAMYGKDLAAAELTVADKIRILIQDPSRFDSKLIMGPAFYTQVDDFTDANKVKHLDVSKPMVAKEGDYVVIEANVAVSLDVSTCYFDLTCRRVRHALF